MSFDWPSGLRECAIGDEKETANALYAKHAREWSPYRGAQRFIREHYPHEWTRLQDCRRAWRLQPSNMMEPITRVLTVPCRCRPFCAACNGEGNYHRLEAAFELVKTGTPKGEHIRTFHFEFVKPGYRGNGGWAPYILRDHRKFMLAAYRVIERMFGKGIGAVVNYQEYGEALFTDLRPHVHCVVNGYRIQDGRVTKTPYYDLNGDGYDRLKAMIIAELHRAYPDAPEIPANEEWETRPIDLEEGYGGDEGQKKALRYNTRELIDPRKWIYAPGSDIIEISSYKDPHLRTSVPIPKFRAKLLEYAHRIESGGYDEAGKWVWPGHGGRRSVDGVYGDFSDRRASHTFKVMGHEHGPKCFCRECKKKHTKWGRVQGFDRVGADVMDPDKWAW